MNSTSITLAAAALFVSSPVWAQCPDRSAITWTISERHDAAQSIFIPTTKTVADYRICVKERVGSARNSFREPQSNVESLQIRIACGANGRDMMPPCVSIPMVKPGSCTDVRTEGTIWLLRSAKSAAGRAEGTACRVK